jgi:succinylarginine dihydrolase
MTALEVNLDGIVGPTHNYAGLSYGNVASEKHAKSISNPKEAALQGLQKMKFVHDLGIPQLVMPPQNRPRLDVLRQLGYRGVSDAPDVLLHQVYSASCMWTANAATVSPSADTSDGKVHFTPANLISNFHRFMETLTTAHYLRQIFAGDCFVHHAPLPPQALFADEGAANHMRLCPQYGQKGTEIFVYGGAARKFPARQTLHAAETVARLHGLDPARTVFLEQHPESIDAGVFHNDVIAMSNGRLFIYHEKAYVALDAASIGCTPLCISEKELPLVDAVSTYFFNSQLVTLANGQMVVIAPSECERHAKAKACFERLVNEGYIYRVYYLDLRESMKNGGGPACLRLRVVLSERERAAVFPHVWLNDSLYVSLCRWIEKHYRDRITSEDLRDPMLAEESRKALDGLSSILKIPMEVA